ncbi:MAG: hybrid sensor histidine kinase/response regulator [Isosphaeraceae bacterium]|nr:hybrid sensor histidine kinase/response regulator [Isosphaeraceae bacterium]
MDRAKLLERLMTTFLGELDEHVRVLNGELLALEKQPDGPGRSEHFRTLFRAAHSLKGAARSVNVGLIEEACHRLEDILGAARDGRLALDRERFALLFAAADAIEEAGMRLREQRDLTESPLAALLPRLEIAVLPTHAPTETEAEPPPALAPDPVAPVHLEPERPHPAPAFVRVPASKLDTLLSGNGELLVARRRVEACEAELAALREQVSRWDHDWRASTRPLGALLARGGQAELSRVLPQRTVQALTHIGARLGAIKEGLDRFGERMAGEHRQLARAAGTLEEEVRQVRMLPFAEACQGLERAARDVARADGKLVELVVEGGDIELDRAVLEGLKDPLLHLVRNAVSHGVELPDARRAAGKPDTATLSLTVSLRGEQVEVVVADDGTGLDYETVRRKAIERGLPVPSDDRDLADLLFLPGFSTAPMVTNVSGRGVGLDVVKNAVEALHGTVVLSSTPGLGTRFTLSVPLTMTTLRALLLKAGGQTFALASASVRTLVRVDPEEFHSIEGRLVLARGGPPVPLAHLAGILGLAQPEPLRAGVKVPGLILTAGDRRAALLVDVLEAEQEIIIKNLGTRIRRLRYFSGATVLADGRVALVLNAGSLLRSALGRTSGHTLRRAPVRAAPPVRKRLVVVDDSVTTRTLEKSILESAGYEVNVAVDGESGWRLLQDQGADLLVTDVEMPRMDGFALTEAVRRSSRFARLPVVLFTSRANERDRARGIEVGADAYIVKGEFDQRDLLETIAQLL